MPHISIITTLYNQEPYVREFYDRTREIVTRLTDDYEYVFVDDGSEDRSRELVKDLIAQDDRVRLVELSRNFGHHKAVMAGLEHVRGDLVYLTDSDLEEPPELLERFYKILQSDPEHVDVVYGYMEERKGRWTERWPGAIFYALINLVAEVEIPRNMMAARLMKKGYVENLVKFQEMHVFLGGIMTLNGYNQVAVGAHKNSKGSTTYTFSKKLTEATDALVSFTNKPLTFIAILGIVLSAVSFIVALVLLVRVAFFDLPIDGLALVLVSLWFLGGLTILSIGLVGFYVGRVFLQVKHRPNAIVKQIHSR